MCTHTYTQCGTSRRVYAYNPHDLLLNAFHIILKIHFFISGELNEKPKSHSLIDIISLTAYCKQSKMQDGNNFDTYTKKTT